jgi:uncharacterized membrane protein
MAERELSTARLEAISDGVIAVIITIMVLELHPPRAPTPAALMALWPQFAIYLVSFLFLAIYWVNHRYLFGHVKRVDERVLWANMGLLFLLSLIPFATAYAGETGLAAFPIAIYAATMLAAGLGYSILSLAIRAQYVGEPAPAAMQRRGLLLNIAALGAYALAIPAAWLNPLISVALIFAPCVAYLTPLARPS